MTYPWQPVIIPRKPWVSEKNLVFPNPWRTRDRPVIIPWQPMKNTRVKTSIRIIMPIIFLKNMFGFSHEPFQIHPLWAVENSLRECYLQFECAGMPVPNLKAPTWCDKNTQHVGLIKFWTVVLSSNWKHFDLKIESYTKNLLPTYICMMQPFSFTCLGLSLVDQDVSGCVP